MNDKISELISKLKEALSSLSSQIEEQAWYQELKSKWEELDPQSRLYLKVATFGSSILVILLVLLSAIWSVHSLKSELYEKRKLLSLIDSANDELRRLKDSAPAASASKMLDRESGPWSSYFESIAAIAGVGSNFSVSSEKPGASGDQSKEALFEISLKHVNIKQAIQYALSLENGQRPVKLRNLTIDTKNTQDGYLDVTLAVSGFTLVVPK